MNNNAYQKTLNAYQRRTDISASSINNDWSSDIENVLEQIRVNCVIMSKEHKSKYLFLKGILRYFRIPIILISSVASVASVGLQPYLDQPTISVITCLLSLTCGIIGSIELFLAIQSSMENELMASKDYYILSIEIFKVLTLDRENRSMDGKSFLETSYGTYVKLIENSNILDEKIADRLTLVVDKSNKYIDSSSSDESPIPPPSPNNKSTILTYFCNKKQNKKNNIEKTQSIDELVESSLKKNNVLALGSQLRPKTPERPPHLQQSKTHLDQPKTHLDQPKTHLHLQQPTTIQDLQPIHLLPIQELQPHKQLPPMQLQQSMQLSSIQVQRSPSYNNLFSDNLSDPFFYNNFMQISPKVFSNNHLPKSLSDNNLQQLSDNSSNNSSNINIHNSSGSIINEEINIIPDDDIIGISEHNLIDINNG